MMRLAAMLVVLIATRAFAATGDVAAFDDRDGATLADVSLIDESGASMRTASLFAKPFYLAFAYHRCPQLCGLVMGQLATALRDVPQRVGDAFDVVVVSIDPADTPERSREAKQRYVARYGNDGTGWHFLTGDNDAIRTLTQSAGFRYVWDPINQTFVHPAGVLYVDRGGIIRGHVEGLDFSATELQAIQSDRSPTSTFDRLCGALGLGGGVRSAAVLTTLRIGGFGALLSIVIGAVIWSRKSRMPR
jgi:protein SCO1